MHQEKVIAEHQGVDKMQQFTEKEPTSRATSVESLVEIEPTAVPVTEYLIFEDEPADFVEPVEESKYLDQATADIGSMVTTQATPDTESVPTTQSSSDSESVPTTQASSDTESVPTTQATLDIESVPTIQAPSDFGSMVTTQATPDTESVPTTQALSDTENVPTTQALLDTENVPTTQASSDTESSLTDQATSDTESVPTIQAPSDVGSIATDQASLPESVLISNQNELVSQSEPTTQIAPVSKTEPTVLAAPITQSASTTQVPLVTESELTDQDLPVTECVPTYATPNVMQSEPIHQYSQVSKWQQENQAQSVIETDQLEVELDEGDGDDATKSIIECPVKSVLNQSKPENRTCNPVDENTNVQPPTNQVEPIKIHEILPVIENPPSTIKMESKSTDTKTHQPSIQVDPVTVSPLTSQAEMVKPTSHKVFPELKHDVQDDVPGIEIEAEESFSRDSVDEDEGIEGGLLPNGAIDRLKLVEDNENCFSADSLDLLDEKAEDERIKKESMSTGDVKSLVLETLERAVNKLNEYEKMEIMFENCSDISDLIQSLEALEMKTTVNEIANCQVLLISLSGLMAESELSDMMSETENLLECFQETVEETEKKKFDLQKLAILQTDYEEELNKLSDRLTGFREENNNQPQQDSLNEMQRQILRDKNTLGTCLLYTSPSPRDS